jgi:alkyl hydroperoxide reductase subunit AhpC
MPALQANLAGFAARHTQVLGVSCDSTWSHAAWAKKLGGITYPLLADYWPHGEVARRYGVLREDGCAERAVFLIDRRGLIRWIDVVPILERPDVRELLHVLRAMH